MYDCVMISKMLLFFVVMPLDVDHCRSVVTKVSSINTPPLPILKEQWEDPVQVAWEPAKQTTFWECLGRGLGGKGVAVWQSLATTAVGDTGLVNCGLSCPPNETFCNNLMWYFSLVWRVWVDLSLQQNQQLWFTWQIYENWGNSFFIKYHAYVTWSSTQ